MQFHQLVYVYLETILCKKKGNNFHVLTPKSLEAILADLQIIEDEFVEETISETTDAGVLTRTKGREYCECLRPSASGCRCSLVHLVV
eukprot:COSAG05_NODE_1882_length_3906_cov_1.643814_2_plen_88_part_00